MSGPKVLDVRWFTGGRGTVGIVCVEMDDEESDEHRTVVRYFIGSVELELGNDQEFDKQEIADWGARFPEAAGALLFGRPI